MTTQPIAGQHVLFGDAPSGTDATSSARRPVGPVSDPESVAAVIRLATDPGYLLAGPADRVLRRDPTRPDTAEHVPTHEQDTVRALLDTGHLRLGGRHHVTYGRHDGPATAVLVPKASRDLAARWAALQPIPTTPTTTRTPAPRPSSGRLFVDVVRPGLGLVTCGGGDFSGSLVREDGRYLVETEHGEVIGRARTYRHGAELLARHHGFAPGDVVVEIERDERP